MSPAPFVFDRIWVFEATPADVWALLGSTDEYRRWWPWLASLDVDGLREGAVARCVVRPPLPYRLRFDVRLDRVESGRLIEGTVTGDLRGPARLELSPAPRGCEARLGWRVEVASPFLARLARFGRPVMQWGHDLVVDMGVRQFRRRALGTGRGT